MGDLFGKGGLVLILIAIVVFGSKKLPDAARNLGKSIRIFKEELDTPGKEESKDSKSDN
ncbi:MAG: twin-arginine translocase TatA/TatE family subunit [Actinomycetales bacterium]|nr:twin-arginine translocase TatA/TatE family subunit [Actinomycetales bacterium]